KLKALWLFLSSFSSCLKVAQLLLLLLIFLSGSRWVLSYKILFLIPSLAILSWILCLAKLYLQWNLVRRKNE
uniref:Uncharacterized protein n=1 Tax=Peromyscus maniculatus bairdii TaxID=230844 RepID=A0A8C8VU61_PERMB